MKSESKTAKSAVDELLEASNTRAPTRFTEPVIADLRRMIEHNDRGKGRRINAHQAMAAIYRDHGVKMGLSLFALGIRECFGRGWGGK